MFQAIFRPSSGALDCVYSLWVHYTTSCNTQSSVLEDGRNYRLKHVELIGIVNKLLLLHLVSCLYYLQLVSRKLQMTTSR